MRKQSGRKALILLSDGEDNGSRTTLLGAIESAQRADTLVYTILFTDPEMDFRGMGHTSSTNPNSSFLNTVITGSDSQTVYLGNSSKNYVDPKLLQGQINNVLGNAVPAGAQVSPQAQIKNLFQPAQPSSEPRGTAPDTEQQTKTKVNAIFSSSEAPAAGPHN